MNLAECGFDARDIASERNYLLLEKILQHFDGEIECQRHPVKGIGKLLFSKTTTAEMAFLTKFDPTITMDFKVDCYF
jgi:hypothetical protein